MKLQIHIWYSLEYYKHKFLKADKSAGCYRMAENKIPSFTLYKILKVLDLTCNRITSEYERRLLLGLFFQNLQNRHFLNFRSSIFVKLSEFVPFEESSKKSQVKIFWGHPLGQGEGGKFEDMS